MDRSGRDRGSDPRRSSRIAAACFIVSSMLTSPALAFRTGEDSPALAGKGHLAWDQAAVPFRLSAASLPRSLQKREVEEALLRAMQSWAAPTCSDFEPFFAGWTDEALQPMDGVNTIGWVDDWAKRGLPESAPGNTDVQYRGHGAEWRIEEADVYLNAADFDWSTDGSDTSVQVVLTHELGHAVGLLHPCEPQEEDGAPACEHVTSAVEATTMFPFYDAGQASLAEDDIAGLCYLYPLQGECGACQRDETCVDGQCRATCQDAICEASEACGAWGCGPKAGCLARDCVGTSCDDNLANACGPLARCSKGTCVKGSARWGDACDHSEECAQGACLDGICQPDCVQDLECGAFGACLPTADGAYACADSSAYDIGFRCASGQDCESQICVFSDGIGTCTDTCTSSSTCDADWSCIRVEGNPVCVPPNFKARGGCHVAVPAGAPRHFPTELAVALATLLATRRRRKNDR